jgi:sacsin
MFSITSDRASIHSRAEKSLQDRRPFLWNEKLFRSLIPDAWASLLDHLRSKWHDAKDLMDYWPRSGTVVGQLGGELCHDLVEFVQISSLRVFFTENGFVDLEGGLFTKADEVSEELRLALKEADVPVVYIQKWHMWLHDEVVALCPSRLLNPKSLCDSLRSSNSLEDTSVESKRSLLEYILSKVDPVELAAGLKILYGIPLFRMQDETYHANGVGPHPLFMSEGEIEDRVFQFQPERNLDLSLMSTTTVGILRNLATAETTSICRHSVDSFIEYCLPRLYQMSSTPERDQDVVPLSPTLHELIDDVWSWLMVNAKERRVFSRVSSLWLIPLHGGRYLRRPTTFSRIPTLHSLSGTTGELLIRLADSGSQSTLLPLLDTGLLRPKSQRFLVERGESRYGMTLGHSENLENLLPWLVAGKEAVRAATDEDKRLLLAMIAGKFMVNILDTVAGALKQLPLFEQVLSRFIDDEMLQQRQWIDQCQGKTLVGIGGLPFAPDISGVAFVRCDDQNVRNLLRVTCIASWPSAAVLLEDYLIPSLTPEKCSALPDVLKIRTLEFILCNHIHLSPKCRLLASKLSIVPVEMAQSEASSPVEERQAFRSMSELLDPRALDLKGLFFSEELLYPCATLLNRFDGVMQHYGLKSRLTWELAVDRIRLYAATGRPLEEVETRVRTLLQMPIDRNIRRSDSELQEIKNLEWFVAKSVQNQQWVRMKPTDCQDFRYHLVIGRVASVLEYEMHVQWHNLLSRNWPFRACALEAQLKIGIAEMDMDIVDAVLAYIQDRGLQADYVEALRPLACVLGRSGKLFSHDKIFQFDATSLRPHLDVVEDRFLLRHRTLLKELGVARRPSLDDLFWVQEQLATAKQPLDEANIAIAVEVVKLASSHDRSKLTVLKIPDQTGRLQAIENITSWDMDFFSRKQTIPLVHPWVPPEVVEKLAIQTYSEKRLMGMLGADDQEDDDEYFQHEETTTRIADTLGRYSIASTFSEYLANAEDSSATRIDWLLDECLEGNHPTSNLLTRDLQALQGPSLFVHNDSMFLDEDFDGFKNVGRGSKREEEWAIGQFGRGAQTMYHWTDVPMLISGKYFLILDPQQKFLPLNRRHGRRKPGLKLELSKLRETCPDQLASFDGLWGYSNDLDDYEGTIFRFPLRSQSSETKLTEHTLHLGCSAVRKHLEDYFPIARTSLLFLQKVKQISFRLRQGNYSLFEVHQREEQRLQSLAYQPFESVRTEHFHMNVFGKKVEGSDEWRIARQDILSTPEELKEWQKRTRKRQKYSKCGIAALLSQTTIPGLKPRMFSSLPLPFESHLPVHINASFALSGDRRSILVEETASFDGSAWNRWLLDENLPCLYLQFLEDLVRILGTDVFRFWPTAEISRDSLSDILRAAFWRKVPFSRYRLYPQANRMIQGPVLRTGRGRGNREPLRPIVSWELKEAMFDFLCNRSSHNLQDLLRSWNQNLVRVNLHTLSKSFKALTPPISEITPSCIRKSLQSTTVCDELEKCSRADPSVLDELLQVIWPRRDQERGELDGCRILPLQDGSLGVLRLAQSGRQTYFFTTVREQKLFGFASRIFVRAEVENTKTVFGETVYKCPEFLQWLVKSSAFNVRNLSVEDLKQVLSCRNSADWAPTPALESWLKDFWAYFNKQYSPPRGETGAVTVAQCGIENFQLFKASKGPNTIYISPTTFESLPAVVGPWEKQPALLCAQFPDLYIVNSAFVPDSLARENFVPRFLKAIREISNTKRVDLGEFLSSSLNRYKINVQVLNPPRFQGIWA